MVLNTAPDVSGSTSPVFGPPAVSEAAMGLIERRNFLIDNPFPQRDDPVTASNQGQNRRSVA